MCSGESKCAKNFGSVTKQLQISLLKHHLKDSQPGKTSPLHFRKGYFCKSWPLKGSPRSFGLAIGLLGRSLMEGNFQLAISEMEISFPKIFGLFNFQLRNPD